MLARGRAGVSLLEPGPSFAAASDAVIGNQTPAWTGTRSTGYPAGPPDRPGPHPGTQPLGGQTGDSDAYSGADPSRPKMSPSPSSVLSGAWGEGDVGAAHGLPDEGHQSDRRYGLQGFNDQLQVRDRHVYWDRGRQRFGSTPSVPGTPPNPHSDGPAVPGLRVVNRSVNPQIGSDATRNQDDLTRPYTWLGQQDGTISAVYGGVPGLWQSYGNRGFADGIHDPSGGEGGLSQIAPGPPHGLHSDTLPDGKQIADRYRAVPQMRPVRQDRPDNSRIAGQSFSQTVVPQGAAPPAGPASPRGGGLSLRIGGRGWLGGGGQ
jgi:hypothetical protein